MSLKVRDLMCEAVVAVTEGDDLATVRELMDEHQIRHLPVVDEEGELLGLVSHRDLLRSALIERADLPDYMQKLALDVVTVREVMTSPVAGVDPEADIREAAQLMLDNKYGCLPVVEGMRLVGILTEADFVRFLAEGE